LHVRLGLGLGFPLDPSGVFTTGGEFCALFHDPGNSLIRPCLQLI
jgi:hypothetical protein